MKPNLTSSASLKEEGQGKIAASQRNPVPLGAAILRGQATPLDEIVYERFSDPQVPHCCLTCGFVPIEGMTEYLSIHGEEAECISCKGKLPHKPPFIDPWSIQGGAE